MTIMDDLRVAVSRANSASDSATRSSNLLYEVANGDVDSFVETDGGPVQTVAGAIRDIIEQVLESVMASQVVELVLPAGQTTVDASELYPLVKPLVFVEGSFEYDFTFTESGDITFGESFANDARIWVVQGVAVSSAADFFVRASGTPIKIDSIVQQQLALGTEADAYLSIFVGGAEYKIPAYNI